MIQVKKADLQHLAECVAFSLRCLQAGRSGAGVMFDMATGKVKVWQHDFMDALEKIGIVVDRKAYFEGQKPAASRGKTGKNRETTQTRLARK